MGNAPEFPDWLEACRVDDDLFGEAYEDVPPSFRASIKTGIALASFYFSDKCPNVDTHFAHAHLGFQISKSSRPADWTAIIFPEQFCASARVAAASVLATVAGVRTIFAICAGGIPASGILATFELCGIEDVFSLSSGKITSLFAELSRQALSGRIVLFNDGFLPDLAAELDIFNYPVYEEKKAPNILVRDKDGFSPRLMEFLHATNHNPHLAPDAIYGVFEKQPGFDCKPEAPLLISPGCEGFWLLPQLGLDFFKTTASLINLAIP